MPSTLLVFHRNRAGLLPTIVTAVSLAVLGTTAAGQASPDDAGSKVRIPVGATAESLFKDFVHYAKMGRFQLADGYAQSLLVHPELDPVRLVAIADADPESIKTLLRLIRIATIEDSAKAVLELLQQGEQQERQSAGRILANIELLGGDPQQEFFAIKYLAESGEYAIPHMVDTLLDQSKSRLWPRVTGAFPRIGKGALNPLVMALRVNTTDLRLNLIHALGEIGYPQALPYLRAILAADATTEQTRTSVLAAIERIEVKFGRTFPGSADELFVTLANQYYEEDDAVRADPRVEEANVWYWDEDDQHLRRVVVPRRIFGQVMAMRCCEEAMRLKNDQGDALALWLAANVRREGRLGLDVESDDPEQTGETDATRPEVYPRALYFTQSAGPRYAHQMLARAVRDLDSTVALGAIEALRITAGETSLIGTEDFKQPLVHALQFSDTLVRIRSALALGSALPKSPFAGAHLIIPVLSATLNLSGREQVVVIDPDEMNLNRVVSALRAGGREVIGDVSFFKAMERTRTEFQNVVGVFLATDLNDPPVADALRRLRTESVFGKTAVVVLTKSGQSVFADDLAENYPYIETVAASAGAAGLDDAFDRVRARTRQARLDEALAQSLAIEAAETLGRIAIDGSTVCDVADAEPGLIAALASSDEALQTLVAKVLALLSAPTSQRAIAFVALNDSNAESLRVSVFGSLAESAKRNGNLLEDDQVTALIDIAREDPDLIIRTAASQALGAINIESNKASEIIRSFYRG